MPSLAQKNLLTTGDLKLRALLEERRTPLTVADFMNFALQDPDTGYYQKKLPLGTQGDFITAPEISPLFGEIVAAHLIHRWQEQASPTPFSLVELGPGRGTLMADLLRVAKKVAPAFLEGARLHLVERHPDLRRMQKESIPHPITWHETLESALTPSMPLYLVANEFFDALPLHQYEKTPLGWQERGITLSPQHDLCWTHIPTSQSFNVPGDFFEVSPLSQEIMAQILTHLKRHSGSAFICDYGYEKGYQDTLQGVKNHHYHDALTCVGDVDLSAHVDFGAFVDQASRASVFCRLMTQRGFLVENFIEMRLDSLMHAPLSWAVKRTLQEGVARLINQDHMGSLFKVLLLEAPRR